MSLKNRLEEGGSVPNGDGTKELFKSQSPVLQDRVMLPDSHGAQVFDGKSDLHTYTVADLQKVCDKAKTYTKEKGLTDLAGVGGSAGETAAEVALDKAMLEANILGKVPATIYAVMVDEVLGRKTGISKKANEIFTENEISKIHNTLQANKNLMAKFRNFYSVLSADQDAAQESVAHLIEFFGRVFKIEPEQEAPVPVADAETQQQDEGMTMKSASQSALFQTMAKAASMRAQAFQMLAMASSTEEECGKSAFGEYNYNPKQIEASAKSDLEMGSEGDKGMTEPKDIPETGIEGHPIGDDEKSRKEQGLEMRASDKEASLTVLAKVANELVASGDYEKMKIASEIDEIAEQIRNAHVIDGAGISGEIAKGMEKVNELIEGSGTGVEEFKGKDVSSAVAPVVKNAHPYKKIR